MRFSVLLTGIAAAGSIAAADRTCGAVPPRAYEQEFTQALSSLSPEAASADLTAGITIDTYLHVLTSGQTGNIPVCHSHSLPPSLSDHAETTFWAGC